MKTSDINTDAKRTLLPTETAFTLFFNEQRLSKTLFSCECFSQHHFHTATMFSYCMITLGNDVHVKKWTQMHAMSDWSSRVHSKRQRSEAKRRCCKLGLTERSPFCGIFTSPFSLFISIISLCFLFSFISFSCSFSLSFSLSLFLSRSRSLCFSLSLMVWSVGERNTRAGEKKTNHSLMSQFLCFLTELNRCAECYVCKRRPDARRHSSESSCIYQLRSLTRSHVPQQMVKVSYHMYWKNKAWTVLQELKENIILLVYIQNTFSSGSRSSHKHTRLHWRFCHVRVFVFISTNCKVPG